MVLEFNNHSRARVWYGLKPRLIGLMAVDTNGDAVTLGMTVSEATVLIEVIKQEIKEDLAFGRGDK